MTSNKKQAWVNSFLASVRERFEIDEDIVVDLGKLLTDILQSTPKKSGHCSGYNDFVRENMALPEIRQTNYKERMSAIAAKWNVLSPEDKNKYLKRPLPQEVPPAKENLEYTNGTC